jgi:hypothetical protein
LAVVYLFDLLTNPSFFYLKCFDLQNFVSSNGFVSGSRWRCASCETFVSVDSLEVCGLTSRLLDEFKTEASPERDRIEFRSDGTYSLLPEKTPQYAVRRRSEPDEATSMPDPVAESTIEMGEVIDLS